MIRFINIKKRFKEFNRRKKLFAIFLSLVILITLFSGAFWINRVCKSYYDSSVFDNLDLSNVDKLMIVAHSDDETLWGGGHLIEGGYLVVCFTGSSNKIRKDEFINAVTKLNETNIPIVLDFPDKTFTKRDNWFGIENKIIKTVDKLLEIKDWNLIVTHNKSGEYGHIHHKKISSIVTKEYNKLEKSAPLYYYGTYHSKKKIPKYEDQMIPMDGELYNTKVEVLKLFSSQKKVINNLFHMMKYENWIKYNGKNI